MFWLIKKIFIELLTGIANGSYTTKCVSLSNEKYEIQTTLTNLYSHEYSQERNYYPFSVKLGRYDGSCNTLNDLSNKVSVQNKKKKI